MMATVAGWAVFPSLCPGGLICPCVLLRPQRPPARGGGPGRGHGDGADIHGPEERREAGKNLPDHHQVRRSRADPFRHVRLCAAEDDTQQLLYMTIITHAEHPLAILNAH